VSAASFALFATALGYGALARGLGFTLEQTLFLVLTVYALPGQVVALDEISRGADLIAATFVVTLTAIRMLPMTVTLVPLLREGKARKPGLAHILAVHFVSVTTWLEAHRLLPALPPRLRLAFFLGLGPGYVVIMGAGAFTGHVLAANLPSLLSAGLLLMTPIYFMCSLIVGCKARAEYLAVVLGAVLGPLMHLLAPGYDLAITGLVGGTLAWALGRPRR